MDIELRRSRSAGNKKRDRVVDEALEPSIVRVPSNHSQSPLQNRLVREDGTTRHLTLERAKGLLHVLAGHVRGIAIRKIDPQFNVIGIRGQGTDREIGNLETIHAALDRKRNRSHINPRFPQYIRGAGGTSPSGGPATLKPTRAANLLIRERHLGEQLAGMAGCSRG